MKGHMDTSSVNVLYEAQGIKSTFDETRALVHIALSICPTNEDIDKMWTVISTFIANYDSPCVLHMQHVETPNMEPPGLPTMIHIVSKVVSDFPKVRSKCRQIIVQPKYIDDKVMLAQQVFRGLITAHVPLEITADSTKVKELICGGKTKTKK